MLPVVDNNHVTEGLALFTDHFRNQPVITALTAVYLRRVQDVENVLWQVINSRLLANTPTGDVLTNLGKLVGQPRGIYNDADMLSAVSLRVLANKSDGLANDLIYMASKLAEYLFASGYAFYEVPTASFGVVLWDLGSPDLAQSLLHATRAGGRYGVLDYSTWTTGNDLTPNSVYASGVGQGGFGSVYSGGTGGLAFSARGL